MRESRLSLLLFLSLAGAALSGSPSSQQSLSPASADSAWVTPTLVAGLSRSGAEANDQAEGLDRHFDSADLEEPHDESYAEASQNFQQVAASLAKSEEQLTVPSAAPPAADPSAVTSAQGPTGVATRARVDFYVMSRCPDSRRCANEFAPAIKKLHSLKAVDVHVNYIASIQNGRHRCMHGDQECVDNLYQICARELYSGSKQNLEWFDFMLCSMNTRNGAACAQQYKLDFRAIQACASSNQGSASFTRSIKATRDSGVDTSCTISVDKQRFCVHNGGWQNCNYGSTSQAMINYICKKHAGTCMQS